MYHQTIAKFKILIFIGLTSLSGSSADTDLVDKTLVIRFENHRFSPQSLVVPANRPLQLRVVNLSNERIEFESFSLNREKVVEPSKSVTLNLPALRPGNYDFVDDFHDDVPAGVIAAK